MPVEMRNAISADVYKFRPDRTGIALKLRMTCWIAPRDVTPGAFYADEIVHALDAAKAIVLILPQSSAASPHATRTLEDYGAL